jgi:hypothetical protein
MTAETQVFFTLGFGHDKGTNFASKLYTWGQNSHCPLDRKDGSKQTGCTAGLDMQIKRITLSLQEIESQHFSP